MGGSHRRSDGANPGGGGNGRSGGRAERRRAAKRAKARRRRSRITEIPLIITAAVLIALGVKTFLVQAFVIPSGSMEQTIRIGDRVVVDKLTPWFGSKPERGDVVVFRDPGGWLPAEEQAAINDDPIVVKQLKEGMTFIGLLPSEREQDLIKRVVAVGGDRVRCCDGADRVTVNGEPLVEPYLNPGDKPSKKDFDVAVPKGRLFVMGDHRSNSADSRYHLDGPFNGTIDEELVVGRAMAIAWPLSHWDTFDSPDTYASVPESGTTAHRVSSKEIRRIDPLPTPEELSLVMGVVGVQLIRRGRRKSEEWMWGTWQSVRSPVTRTPRTPRTERRRSVRSRPRTTPSRRRTTPVPRKRHR